jgi:hypothetical protein
MRRIACFALCLSVSIATYACKDDDKKPPVSADNGNGGPSTSTGGGTEGGAGDASSIDGGGDGAVAACNSVTNDGDAVEQNRIVGDPPIGSGGTIAVGTYELTQADVYVGAGGTPGPSGVTYRGILVSGPNFKIERVTQITANQGATPVERRSVGDAEGIGPALTITESCPVVFKDPYSYSVVNNTLNITSTITKESFTYTLR